MNEITIIDEIVSTTDKSIHEQIKNAINTELKLIILLTLTPSVSPLLIKKQKVDSSVGWTATINILMESSKEWFNYIIKALMNSFKLQSH